MFEFAYKEQNPLTWPIAKVFKQDHRSKVWQTSPIDGKEYVIKLFTFNPIRQTLLAMIGLHPAQQEIRAHKRLQQLNIPVEKILHHGTSQNQWYLITQAQQSCIYNWIRNQSNLNNFQQRHAIARQLGNLVGQLLQNGHYFKDMKQSNVIIDSQQKLKLIDAGSVKRIPKWSQKKYAIRMLTLLHQTSEHAAAHGFNPHPIELTKTDQWRVVKSLLQLMPELKPDLLASLRSL